MREQISTVEAGLTITGQVTIGFPPRPGSYSQQVYANTRPDTQPATWLRITPDHKVTAYAGKVEYGQGVRHGFAVEVADELGLQPTDVEVLLGDTAQTPWDGGTNGSRSTATVGLQLRKAAATARETLLELASTRLDLPVNQLHCRSFRVESRNDPHLAVTWDELLIGQNLNRDVSEKAALKQAQEFTVMGEPTQRTDALARVTGRARYSQDIQVTGMLYAKVVRPPSYGATLSHSDTSIAKQMPGVRQVVQDGELVAVLAEDPEQADAAARTVKASWQEVPGQPPEWEIPTLLQKTGHDFVTTQEAGSLEEGFRSADHILEATYYVPYISTVPMEPRAAVAQWDNGKLTVWAGTQRPFGIRAELAAHFQVPESEVRVIAPEIGGGFGGKSFYIPALEAARLAKLAGRPVRVALTRAEEMTWTTFRPAALIQIKSGFKSDGTIVAWEFTAYHAGPTPFIGQRGSRTPYSTPNVKVSVASSDSPLRTGSYRSLGGAVNHFAREVHIDEIAATLGIDPVELRLRNLTHPRFRGALTAAAERFAWTPGKQPSRRGIGIALGEDVGSYTATAVQVQTLGSEVRVQRVAVSLDCGLIVNPEGVRNQIEGSIVMGMGTALYEGVEFRGGRLLTSSFARYRVPHIMDTPIIETVLIGDDTTPSTGAGEPAIVPIAAAIANAVFDLTGHRLRELPIQKHLKRR